MKLRSSLTRSVSFFALHHLRRLDWSDARNQEVFGSLGDPAGHGHDYVCTVRVSGPLEHGMVMDLLELDRLLELVVRAPLSGRHLNRDIAEFSADGTLPTCEAIADYVYRRLLPRLPAALSLDLVRIAEDATLSGEARGM
jgi:6-pyruvoyltetrahydropterin/6-carboxytetrahydropterin synthase